MFLQQIKKGLVTLVVKTSLHGGAVRGRNQGFQLSRSRSLSSATGLAWLGSDGTWLGSDLSSLKDSSNTPTPTDQPIKPRDRIMKEIILHKGQHQEVEHPEPESDQMSNIKYVNIRSKYI